MSLLCKVTAALAMLAVVSGDDPPAPPPDPPSAPAAPGDPGAPATGAPGDSGAPGTPGDPGLVGLGQAALGHVMPFNAPPPPMDPASSTVMKIFNWIGVTSLVQRKLEPLTIPTDLSKATDEELMEYAGKLMKRRRALQRKMTRHLLYSGVLLYWLRLYGSSQLVKGLVISLYYLNNNFRETINADWMIHQKQLSDFILEYVRVKKLTLDNLARSKIAGVPYMQIPTSENRKGTFPVWVTQKGQTLPAASQVKGTLQLLKNWWLRR